MFVNRIAAIARSRMSALSAIAVFATATLLAACTASLRVG
jgi:hypothetical protein